ncbi:dipeptide/oligopeptide/nickel ABC transporter ATP-binding protein [Cytobacillus horneckiae]|uniref:ABC transporter ATP-binding protein n=1 Tax=Cytobacillus horneckiae TaxID=549687 RepID=UPI00399F70A1
MLLELRNVTKEYPLRARSLFKPRPCHTAVKQINLQIKKGECVGLVGESGSGKSTIAKLIMKMESVTSGQIILSGHPIHERNMKDLKLYKHIQLVFQDSSSSLHPKMKVRQILAEPLCNYFSLENAMLEASIQELLMLVKLDVSLLNRYPHQLSGGQKQRVCIAKALAVKPEIIIFDESIASLDQHSQIEIINMLKLIKQKQKISYLFITHDLKSTQKLCDRVMVIYQGEIVEAFSSMDSHQFSHPYTRLLFQDFEAK